MSQEETTVPVPGPGEKQVFQNTHPLNNHLVLEQVFQHVNTLDTLKSARLVNRTWYNVSTGIWKAWRKVLTLTITPGANLLEEEEDELTRIMTLEQLKALQQQDNSNSQFERYPYRHYKIEGWTIKDNQFKEEELDEELNPDDQDYGLLLLQKWFWNYYGWWMTKVTFSKCKFPRNQTPFRSWFLEKVPHLSTLELVECSIGDQGGGARVAVNEIPLGVPIKPWKAEKNAYKHEALKNLTLDKISGSHEFSFKWHQFLDSVPNLEKLFMKNIDAALCPMLTCPHGLPPTLKVLDVMDFCRFAQNNWSKHFAYYPEQGFLEELHVDMGYGNKELKLSCKTIELHGYTLKKLHLYRAPYSAPIKKFSFPFNLLTELYLWGNITDSLDFLQFLPELKVLVMNTSCWERRQRQVQIQVAPIPLFDKDLVQCSKGISPEFEMRNMERLEFDWGPLWVSGWKQLGKWMPNLKRVKGMVTRDEQLMIMAQQWKELEWVELAHGSELMSGRGITVGLARLTKLKYFGWKGCACTRQKVKWTEEKKKEMEEVLGRILEGSGGNWVLPWNVGALNKEEVCAEARYKAVMLAARQQ